MKVLFVSRWFPYPADNGSRLRVMNLLRQLARRHSVHLVSFTSEPVAAERTDALREWCESVDVVPYQEAPRRGIRYATDLFSTTPRSLLAADNPLMRATLAQAVALHRPELAIASELGTAPYVAELPVRLRLLEDLEVGVIYGDYASASDVTRKARLGLTWWKLSQYVRQLLRSYHACTAVSDVEETLLRPLIPAGLDLFTVPNAVDVGSYSGVVETPEPDTLIYPGALSYHANYDAARYFVAEVLPLMVAVRPNVKLRITGSLDGIDLDPVFQSPNVLFTGRLPDVRSAIARSWAVPVPLRVGGGTRLKILEALALGTPVVSTSKGAEGLALAEGEGIWRADTPQAMSDAILRLLSDADVRRDLAQKGRAAVAERYDWERVGAAFVDRVDALEARSAGVLAGGRR